MKHMICRASEPSKRQCENGYGKPKARLTMDRAHEIVAQDPTLQIYTCQICKCIHVGHGKTVKTPWYDVTISLELGERVETAMRRENSGTPQRRVDYITRLARKAKVRAATSTS